jgi:putative isomerase
MVRLTTLPLERAWNSWDSERPAAMVFAPLGLALTPCAYAASANRFTEFRGTGGVRLGPRGLTATHVSLTLRHAGTELAWSWRRDVQDPFTLAAAWDAHRFGEWGLRFWLVLVCSADSPGTVFRHDPAGPTVTAAFGHRHLALVAERPPLLVTAHADLASLAAEYEREGYFFLGSRADAGELLALRWNLDEMPTNRLAAALADDPGLALAKARDALSTAPGPAPALPGQTGEGEGALDAVRDVVAWNTVLDPVNHRPYTAISRNWTAQKFGGFGVWLDDLLFHALMAGPLDVAVARENLAAVFAGQTPQGNLPCLVTARDAWVDRSQPPLAAWTVLSLALRGGNDEPLAALYPALARNHAWWWRERDPDGRGLVAFGTSAVGGGLYLGTKLAAKDESFMDNSPMHDEARLDPATRTLDVWDVGLNALLCLDAEMLALLAARLGDAPAAAGYADSVDRHRSAIRAAFWDEERQVFANRRKVGGFVRSVTPTSFFPLLAAAATPGQAVAMVGRWLDDPGRFATPWRLPSVTRDDPAFADNVYWRGRVWPPLNYLAYYGLRRAGHAEAASALAADGHRLFARSWASRLCPENANALTGEALDQPDTDGFYGWGALWPYLAVADRLDVDPLDGFSLRAGGGDVRLGPVAAPAGSVSLEVAGGVTTLRLGPREVLRTTLTGRVTRLEFGPHSAAMVLPAVQAPARLELPAVRPASVLAVMLGSVRVAVGGTDGLVLELPAGVPAGTRLLVAWESG